MGTLISLVAGGILALFGGHHQDGAKHHHGSRHAHHASHPGTGKHARHGMCAKHVKTIHRHHR